MTSRIPALALLLLLAPAAAVTDTIRLRDNLRFEGVEVTGADHRRITFRQNGRTLTEDLRNVLSVEFSPRTEERDTALLRDGRVLSGTVVALAHDGITFRPDDDTALVTVRPDDARAVLGERRFVPYRPEDGRTFFLLSRTVYFDAGRPQMPVERSRYRFTAGVMGNAAAGSMTFLIPDKMKKRPGPGYGFRFELSQAASRTDALFFTFAHAENPVHSPDSLGSAFSPWRNIMAGVGFRRHFPLEEEGAPMFFGDLRLTGVVSLPPENERFAAERRLTFGFGGAAGWYFTENLSVAAEFLFAEPEFTYRYLLPNGYETTVSTTNRILYLFLQLQYSIGSGE